MNNLIPKFIHDKYKENKKKDNFKATTLFIDISGFTPMTERLMREGKEGVEILSEIINKVFNPLINAVYNRSGFISGFAGDAFTAIFPINEDKEKNNQIMKTLFSAIKIKESFQKHGRVNTRFGTFNLSIKIGVSYGNVEWGIIGTEKHYTYFFRGEAIDGCADSEHQCSKMDIIVNSKIMSGIQPDKVILGSMKLNEEANKYIKYYKLSNINEIEGIVEEKGAEELSQEVIKKFLPENILNNIGVNELRDITSVFISFDSNNIHNLEELNRFVNSAIHQADQWGGYIKGPDFGDKGGTLLIIFGAPVSYENNIERAINFINELKSIYKDSIKAGITFGSVYAGIIGNDKRSAYDVLGDVINLSARFMIKGKWGDIWLSEAIKDEIDNKYELNNLGKMLFKGKSEPQQVFSLLGKKEEINSNEKIFKGKMVGREREIANIKNQISTIYEGKFAGVRYIYGEAGSGKSRVCYEVSEDIKNEAQTFTLQTDSIIKKSMNPFTSAFKQYFNQKETLSQEEKESNFKRNFDELMNKLKYINIDKKIIEPVINELQRTKPFIKAMLELDTSGTIYEDLEPKGRFDNTLYAVKEFFKAQSLIKPTIIILEDIQWLDEDSYTLSEILTRNIEHFPIIIICTSRFNDDGTKPKLRLDKGIKEETMELSQLSTDSIMEIVKDWTGKYPNEKLLSFIETKTTNPFTIEQYCLYFLENDLLEEIKVGEYTKYTLKSTLEGIPKSVNAILIARIDRLSKELKETVQVSSIFGKEFEINVLMQMFRLAGNILQMHNENIKVGNLLKKGIKQSLWSKITEIRYTFKNALISEIAYDMQLRARLRNLHKLAAQSIEKLYRDEPAHYTDLAYHYEKSEIRDKAKDYLKKAADYSKQTYENNNAIKLYKRLLKHLDKPKEIIEIKENIAEIYTLIGKWKDAEEIFKKNTEKSEDINYEEGIAYNKSRWGELLHNKAMFDESQKKLNEAYSIYKKLDNKEGLSYVNGHLGIVYHKQGDFERAMEYYEKRLKIAEELNDKAIISKAIGNMGIAYKGMNNFDKAMEYYRKQYKLSEEVGLKLGLSKALANMGVLYYLQGNYNKALECYQKQLDTSAELGHKLVMSNAYGNIGVIYYVQGKYDKAIEFYHKQHNISVELGNKMNIGAALNNLATVSQNMGRYEEAIKYQQRSFKIFKEFNNKMYIITNCTSLGNLYKKLFKYRLSEQYYKEAIEISKKYNIPNQLAPNLFEKADLYFTLKMYEEAGELITEALELAKQNNLFDVEIECKMLEAKMAMHKDREIGIKRMETLLNNAFKNNYQDDILVKIYYNLYKMTYEEKYKNESLHLYQKLYEKTPDFEYKEKINDLKGME